jgi:hypothetical protein
VAVHILDIIVVCAAVLVLIACGQVLARQRFMLRAQGATPVALRSAVAGRWQYGVARYAGGELRWYRSLGLGTRPNRVLLRRDMSVLGRRAPVPTELASLPPSAVIVEVRDGDVDVVLALGESAYTGFVSWLESSAPMA